MTSRLRTSEDPDVFPEYAGEGERGLLITDAIINYTKMKQSLDDRVSRREKQGRSLVKFNPYQGQGRILLALSKKESISQAELARKLGIKPQTLSTALKKLEKAGLISRSDDPLDARSRLVSLTEKGNDLNARIAEEATYSGSMFEALDNDELVAFALACEKLTFHLRAEIRANEAIESLIEGTWETNSLAKGQEA